MRARLVRRADRRDALRAQIARGRLRALLGGWRMFRERGRRAAEIARRLERARR
jgi:hypothetical protein